MEDSRSRAGVVRRVSRKSKRVRVSNLDLPPERDERTLGRFERWQIDRPYFSTSVSTIPIACFAFALGWYLGKPLVDILIAAVLASIAMALTVLGFARNRRRLYRRPYRRND